MSENQQKGSIKGKTTKYDSKGKKDMKREREEVPKSESELNGKVNG